MAKIMTAPDFSKTLPTSGSNLLQAMTSDTIWQDTTLQYYIGDNTALSIDTQFTDEYGSFWSNNPDLTYFFTTLTDRAFAVISTAIPMGFSKTTDLSAADEVLVSVNQGSSIEGFSTFPGMNAHEGLTDEYWSFTAYNSNASQMRATAETGGGEYANWTILHEIGHSLGLYHPFQGAAAQFIANMDNERYTVMSYDGASFATAYGHAVTMMALDIAGLQALYGKAAYAEGNSTYMLLNAQGGSLDLTEDNIAIGQAYYCIWDSGGTDTVTYGNTGQSVLINLNAATLNTSHVAASAAEVISALKDTAFFAALDSILQLEITDPGRHAGGFFSRVLTNSGGTYSGIDGGYAIAHGARIENATGGDQADLLIGNAIANKILGLDGLDTLLGSGGNDQLYGGAGDDTLIGGTGKDLMQGGGGADMMTGGKEKDRFQYLDASDSVLAAFDTIRSFAAGSDVIDLKALDANANKTGDQAFTFIGGRDFSGRLGELHTERINRAHTANDVTYVEVDQNGDKLADLHVELTGLIKLHASDFIL